MWDPFPQQILQSNPLRRGKPWFTGKLSFKLNSRHYSSLSQDTATDADDEGSRFIQLM